MVIFFLRPKRGSALNLYRYYTPLDDLKFIISLKTADDQTFNYIAICKWESKIESELWLHGAPRKGIEK